MTEQVTGVGNKSNSSVRSLGIMIVVISLVQFIITVLLLTQENVSYIFVITQNLSIIAFSFGFVIFSYKFKSTLQSLETEKKYLIFRDFTISLLAGCSIIVLYITSVPIPQPKFDQEGVNAFYGIVTLLNVATILNLLIYYQGVKYFREWLNFQLHFDIPRKIIFGVLLSITALCLFFVANLPLLDAAIKFEASVNPIDPSVFIIHFLIAIALIFIALGFLLIGMMLEVFAGYQLLRISE